MKNIISDLKIYLILPKMIASGSILVVRAFLWPILILRNCFPMFRISSETDSSFVTFKFRSLDAIGIPKHKVFPDPVFARQ